MSEVQCYAAIYGELVEHVEYYKTHPKHWNGIRNIIWED